MISAFGFKARLVLGVLLWAVCTASAVFAEGTKADPDFEDQLLDFLKATTYHGKLRAYFFERAYTQPGAIDQSAFSLGGFAGLITPQYHGLQAGLTLASTNSLGLNPKNPKQVDDTLPGDTIYVLAEAYLEYRQRYFKLRGPDQILDAPWIMASDAREKPSAYRAAYLELYPFKDVDALSAFSLIGLQVFAFNSRDEAAFATSNVYIPGHAGGTSLQALSGQTAPGTTAFALKYGKEGTPLSAQLWWHEFYNFSRLIWLDLNYLEKTSAGINPLFGFQFGSQSPDGQNTLGLAGQGIAGNTQVYGVLGGIDGSLGRITVAYNGVTRQNGAFANGDIISPYSSGYSTDPLYTSQMIGGLIEKQSPGGAFKVLGTVYLLDKQITGLLSYTRFFVQPSANYEAQPSETNLDITYRFAERSNLDGLTIRNRFGCEVGNLNYGHFYYERFQIQYQF